MCLPREIAPWQNGDVVLRVKHTSEFYVRNRRGQPQVKLGRWHLYRRDFAQHSDRLDKLFPVQTPVLDDMGFVLPGSRASRLDRWTHGAAVIGAIEQEFCEDGSVACDVSGAHAWDVGT